MLETRHTLRGLIVALLALVVWGPGCGSTYTPGPPEGWVGTGGETTPLRWWQAGVDTTGLFRDLETLPGMGIPEPTRTYSASGQLVRDAASFEPAFAYAVKRSLIRLYRNQPEVVDSLFEAHVVPLIREADLQDGTALREQVETFKRTGYDALRKHFREARTLLRLGEDVPVVYPDSLREKGIGGDVRVQAYLDEEGVPQAIELIEGVHPVLDDLAMRATTQMRWQPAYLLQKGQWRPIPSWVRFRVRFAATGA